MTKREKIIKLYLEKEVKRKFSYQQIADRVKVSKAWVFVVINEYKKLIKENNG